MKAKYTNLELAKISEDIFKLFSFRIMGCTGISKYDVIFECNDNNIIKTIIFKCKRCGCELSHDVEGLNVPISKVPW